MYFLRFHLVNGNIIDLEHKSLTIDECMWLAEYSMKQESITVDKMVINVKNVIMIQIMEKPVEGLK